MLVKSAAVLSRVTVFDQDEDVSYVKLQSPICRSTILPPGIEDGTQLPVSVQPIRLLFIIIILFVSDTLVHIMYSLPTRVSSNET